MLWVCTPRTGFRRPDLFWPLPHVNSHMPNLLSRLKQFFHQQQFCWKCSLLICYSEIIHSSWFKRPVLQWRLYPGGTCVVQLGWTTTDDSAVSQNHIHCLPQCSALEEGGEGIKSSVSWSSLSLDFWHGAIAGRPDCWRFSWKYLTIIESLKLTSALNLDFLPAGPPCGGRGRWSSGGEEECAPHLSAWSHTYSIRQFRSPPCKFHGQFTVDLWVLNFPRLQHLSL